MGNNIYEKQGTIESGNELVENKFANKSDLPAKQTPWSKFKAFLFQEITIELTPKQQEFENRMNEVLNQEITFKKLHDFLFQEVSFRKK